MNALSNRFSNSTMKPSRNDFFAPIEQVFDSFFNDFFTNTQPSSLSATSGFPKMNAYRHDQELIMDLTVPGMSEEDIDISISDNQLTVSGRMNKAYRSPDGSEFYFREIRQSAFSRTITLPEDLVDYEPNATMKDGLLSLNWKIRPPLDSAKSEVKKIKINKE